MQRKAYILHLISLVLLLGLGGCNLFEGGDTPEPQDKYLVSYNQVNSATPQLIKPVFEALEGQYPELGDISSKVKHGVWVFSINYNTTFLDKPVEASGLVAVPMSTGSFPLLSFQNGTNTLHSMAPSVSSTDNLYYVLEMVASTGFVVVLPDYLGFGASANMFHPYLHKASTVKSVTDMYRAVRELLKRLDRNSLSKESYLMGYSQGGWASMALKEAMEGSLSDEFILKASSCGAGPYDLTSLSYSIMSTSYYAMPYFLAYIFNSWIKSGEITLTYEDIFNSPYSGDKYIESLFDGEHDGSAINAKLSTSVSTLFTQDFRNNYATGEKYVSFRSALERNSIKAWKTTTPTLIMHGTSDNLVPPSSSSELAAGFVKAGASSDLVKLIPLTSLDHQSAVLPWGLSSIKWILEIKGD